MTNSKDTYILKQALEQVLRIEAVLDFIECNAEYESDYIYKRCDEMLKTIRLLADEAKRNLHKRLYDYLDMNIEGINQ